jgi:hypothetical protein
VPRYLVQRTFDGGLQLPITAEGRSAAAGIVDRNADLGVTWVQSFVTEDKARTYCVYDAPNPEAIRKAATCNGLPIESITKVSVLDPYFFL